MDPEEMKQQWNDLNKRIEALEDANSWRPDASFKTENSPRSARIDLSTILHNRAVNGAPVVNVD